MKVFLKHFDTCMCMLFPELSSGFIDISFSIKNDY